VSIVDINCAQLLHVIPKQLFAKYWQFRNISDTVDMFRPSANVIHQLSVARAFLIEMGHQFAQFPIAQHLDVAARPTL
jgi:hypothetical protein